MIWKVRKLKCKMNSKMAPHKYPICPARLICACQLFALQMAAPCYCSWRFMTCPFILPIMSSFFVIPTARCVQKVK